MLFLILALKKRIEASTWAQQLMRSLAVISSILVGFGVYYTEKRPCDDDGETSDCTLSAIDAFYLTIATISTVGYGDISPATDSVRAFTVVYILIGGGYTFVALANLFTRPLDLFSDTVKGFIDRFDKTPDKIDINGDGKRDTSVTGRSKGLSGQGRDLTGDGQIDFIEPPSAFVYWTQETMPAITLLLVLQLVSAAVFVALVPDLDFGMALYHCFVTATTVGFGDVYLSTSEARLFACFHMVISVSWLAALLGIIDNDKEIRASQLARAQLITKPPNREQILSLDRDGKGVDKLEFIMGMMMNLGVQLCGQPLRWDDVRPFLLQFERFDVSKTGRLSPEDLERYVQAQEEMLKRRGDAEDKSRRRRQQRRASWFASAGNSATDKSQCTAPAGAPAEAPASAAPAAAQTLEC